MPANKDFFHRIEIIDECLRNHLQKWTLEKLTDCVNEKLEDRYGKKASRRTIQNDIAYLIKEKNAPINRKHDGHTVYFYYLDKTFSIKNLPIQEEDVSLLKNAISILQQVNEFQILNDVNAIIQKLENTIDNSKNSKPSAIQFERNPATAGTQYIDELFDAITHESVLRITYQPFSKEPVEHIFHPYLLKEYRNRWFVIGRSNKAKNIAMNFALDRIKKIRNSSETFTANDLFDPEKYFNDVIGVTLPPGEKPVEIEIKVSKKQAPYILTKPIHHTQQTIKTYADGSVILKLFLVNNFEFRSQLLSYGCDIEVIKPESLRKELAEIFSTAVKCYQ